MKHPKEAKGLLSFSQMLKQWKFVRRDLEKCIKGGLPHQVIDGKKYFNLKECQKWYAGGWIDEAQKKAKEVDEGTLGRKGTNPRELGLYQKFE